MMPARNLTSAVHFTEARSAIQDLWNHAGMGPLPSWGVGSAPSTSRHVSARDITDLRTWVGQYDPASIIGAHWTNNSRNWSGKSGWDIQLVYSSGVNQSTDPNGSNQVGNDVQSSHQSGRNVLARVDYAPGQSVPPTDAARTTYVQFLQTICQDPRYNQNVWGYIIGNEYNKISENSGGTPVTPAWYARVFNGYDVPIGDTGNAYQFIKSFQPLAHVLVGHAAFD